MPRRPLLAASLAIPLAVLAGCHPKPTYVAGGMWMPEQIPAQASTLERIGLEVDAAALSDPTSGILGAVVSLGGCSASFVSDDGLVATNHHCAIGALQYNSTAKENLIREGFLAKTRADERWNGPSARIYVTLALRDVTRDVRAGLDAIADAKARAKKVEERTKALVAACEKGRPDRRCSVAEYYGGGQYRLVEQLEIKDVRLVFAPHDQIGDYGGEIDNWHWPRHSGDVALFRAYVGPDGKPADHAAANLPYRPPHRLHLATKPLDAGDLVFVAGYPAATNRLRTAAEAEEAVSFLYPYRVQQYEEYIHLLEGIRARKNEELTIKSNSLWRGLNNARTKWKGIVDGLVEGGLAAKKEKADAELAAFIQADPTRKKAYGDVLDKIRALVDERKKTREHDAELSSIGRFVSLLGAANTIVRLAEERAKPDAERDPAYQERNWDRLAQDQQTVQKRYDRSLDIALFKLALQRARKMPDKDRPETVALLLGKDTSDEAIDKALAGLYAGTSLEDEKTRVDLVRKATVADLEKSQDLLIQLARKLRPALEAVEDRDKASVGAMLLLRPRYVEALRAFSGAPIAPDANGTLRITYGTVRGYRPKPEAPSYAPFTTVSEIPKKNTGTYPFDAPRYLLDAIKAKSWGRYSAEGLGEVPVDFLSDLDITGGNSGSPTLNSRGEIVGLAFDGNYESMASDWLFMPEITRTIHVDFRYVLWLLDVILPGKHLVAEMAGDSRRASPAGMK